MALIEVKTTRQNSDNKNRDELSLKWKSVVKWWSCIYCFLAQFEVVVYLADSSFQANLFTLLQLHQLRVGYGGWLILQHLLRQVCFFSV